MKLVIVIERAELNELFAVGPKDLKNHFLPKSLNVKPNDIKECWFEEVSDEHAIWTGKDYTVTTHPDNIHNKRKRSKIIDEILGED